VAESNAPGAGNATAPLNADTSVRACVDTASMAWAPSPSGTVWRKRVHLVGGAESGQVTSVVRYEPGARFPAHDHPEGEEILVLEGVFSDEHGDWPAGTYLLNPEGFRHAPFSEAGCVLFVKLRQLGGPGRVHVALQTRELPWQPGARAGVEEKSLYAAPAVGHAAVETVRLERWVPGALPGHEVFEHGVEVFVLEGSFEDEEGRYGAGAWLRLPPGGSHTPSSPAGCELYVKVDAVGALRSA